jgi:hypothetical protein
VLRDPRALGCHADYNQREHENERHLLFP